MTDAIRSPRIFGEPEDDSAREARHQLLATLLGAYADSELPVETLSQIDAHLLGCGRCRSELRVQQAVSQRLARSTVPMATMALQDRVRAALAATPVAAAPVAAPTIPLALRTRRSMTMLVVAALAILAAVLVRRNDVPQLDPPPLVAVRSVVALSRIVADYRQVSRGDLPGRARDLESVRRSVPFPVTPVVSSEAHLLAAWTTDLDGEPAAVLAYRWKSQVVLQYVVGESALFRSHDVRAAFAEQRAVVTQDGPQGLIAWPEANAGTVLVGDVPWITLVSLSRARVR